MKRKSRALEALAVGVSAALVLTACGGGDSDSGGDSGGGEGNPDGSFSMYIGNPENPLVPGNTSETEGGQVISSLWTGLIKYNVESSEVEYTGVADSIESDDNTTWTVTLKDGWTFHDGTPVTSKSYIDAWNYTALSTNGFGGSYFFANVEGYDDLQAEEGAEPAATEMTGLEAVDDTTFTVTLSSPFAQYPVTVGYSAFYPLPESFFEDPDTFGAQPVGNGPFQATTPFVDGEGFTLDRYEDYAGDDKAKAASVEYRVYTDLNTAYNDVQGGALDVTGDVPPDAIASAEDTFGDRYIERESSSFTYVGFPTYDDRYADKRVRQAISMAIDRQAITDAIFAGSREPAFSAISPVVDGSRDDACEYCVYDVEKAKALLDETDFDTSEPVELWFNAGAGHDEWMQAVGQQLRDNLGLEFKLEGGLQFSEYLPKGDDKGFTGPFRLGWAMDYPSPQNYLEPLYSTSALPPNGSNSAFYSNPEFDDLIAEGNSADSNDAAIEKYQEAEDVMLEDMPIMPMFFGLVQGVYSDTVSNVQIDAFTQVDTPNVVVN